MSDPQRIDCCIVGAGPAGMILGLLMARVGLNVTVLERHKDFDRDFRGDTVHASTLELLDQIGLAERVLELPHAKMRSMTLTTPKRTLELARFDRLPSRFPYVAIMPQASFLEFLCEVAESYSNFRCIRGANVRSLVEEDGSTCGVVVRADSGETTFRASLTVAADGRFSRLRKVAGLTAKTTAPPMDVAWFRVPRFAADGYDTGGLFIGGGRMLVCLPRPQTWQIGYVFPKGDFRSLKDQGLPTFRNSLKETAPWLGDRVESITKWADVHLLSVSADCLTRWYKPGLLLIGDAAHVMSPVGGVGINMAISDAVETANVLAQPGDPLLRAGPPPESALAEVQKRRTMATRITQGFQSRVQNTLVKRAIAEKDFDLPGPVKMIMATPGLRQLPLRVVGLGLPQTRLSL